MNEIQRGQLSLTSGIQIHKISMFLRHLEKADRFTQKCYGLGELYGHIVWFIGFHGHL